MFTLTEIKKQVVASEKLHYVYILYKPNGIPFYVGKGSANRIGAHEAEARSDRTWIGINNLKINTIKKIWQNNQAVSYKIDSWHDTAEEAGDREILLVKTIGRIILNTGPLTNIRDGGEVLSEESRKILSDKLKQYCFDHPEFIENLQSEKDRWIKECPEEYAKTQELRAEIARSPEVRQKTSNTLKEYFSDPEIRETMGKAVAQHYVDNPESIERARQNAIDNKSHEAIIKWLKECPEECREKWDKHSDIMKNWYEQNPEEVNKMLENRNRVLKSDEHRKKMADRIRAYTKNNPEAAEARKDKMQKSIREKKELRMECMKLMQSKLVSLGEVQQKPLTKHELYNWHVKGLYKKHFTNMPSQYEPIEAWQDFKLTL